MLPPSGTLSDLAYSWTETSAAALPLALTPDVSGPSQASGFAALTLRGKSALPLVPTDAELQARRSVRPWDRCQRTEELLQSILAEGRHASLFHVAATETPLPWPIPPMPRIWQAQGSSLGVAALWSSGDRLRSTAEGMRDAFANVKARPYVGAALEEELLDSVRETLASRCEF